jgi:UDP-2-acetamido-3-amino-2,3-dideoxy-glucuronate N-acetyltransferase
MADLFVHPQGINESEHVGAGTRVWAFAHVLPGARIGAECNICDGVFVENDVVVGDRVTVKPGVQLYDGLTLEDDVFVGPNATFTNDRFPRSRQWLESYPRTIVRQGASIGANSTILPGLEIGRGAMIGAGAVVTRSVPPNAIVIGNPGRITGYADAPRSQPPARTSAPAGDASRIDTDVSGVFLRRAHTVPDLRGNLTAGEVGEGGLPFTPQRWFMVYDVPTREIRGEHAHRECHQYLMCAAGKVTVAFDDGKNRGEVLLDEPSLGVYLPPMTWGTQYRYDADAVLMVLASHRYDAGDYIREYDTFLEAVAERDATASSAPQG